MESTGESGGARTAPAPSVPAVAVPPDAPAPASIELPVLWQFRVSHFNEKARWALDYKRIAHVRRTVVPGLHIARVMLLSRQKQVPLLVIDGKAIVGSGAIIEALERSHPEPALYPAEPALRQRALELARLFDEDLGPFLRCAVFYEIFPDAAYTSGLFTQGSGLFTRVAYRAAFPAIRAVMKLDMDINEATARDAVEKTLIALERLDNLIQPSGYLVGSVFSVADLTAAALLSPVVQPPEFAYPFPPPSSGIIRLQKRLGHKRVRDWCLEMYRRHRGTSAEVS